LSAREPLLLKAENVAVCYPTPGEGLIAVRDARLELRAAEVLALVGESGSGKTSLARAILGLAPLHEGRVLFHGIDLASSDGADVRRARRNIQAVFQDPLAALSPRRTVLQSLMEPLDHFRIDTRAGRRDRAAAALAAVELPEGLLARYPHELSGGQRQRVALARALVTEPELIVADEPLSSLDLPLRGRIIELIDGLRRRLGIAFLLVSHDLLMVRQLADRVAVMYAGVLVETGPAASLFSAPAHPYTRALLEAVPRPDPRLPPPAVPQGEAISALTAPAGCVFHSRCPQRFEPCSSRPPPETAVVNGDSVDNAGGQGAYTEHQVRCYLWKS